VLYIQEDFKPNEDSKETSEEKPESLTALLDEFIRTENVPPISFEARPSHYSNEYHGRAF
jgi:hypothetical protein